MSTTSTETATLTIPALLEKARAEWKREKAEAKRKAEVRRRLREEQRRKQLVAVARERIGLDIPVELVSLKPIGDNDVAPYVYLEHDLQLTVDNLGYLRVGRPCPDCDGNITLTLNRLSDLGAFLAGEAQDFHEHWYARGSTHPKAPLPFDAHRAEETLDDIGSRLVGLIEKIAQGAR